MSTPESVRVLLVEPHADTREMYVVGLTYRGFRVFTARDESSAAAAFATHAPNIVVSDTRIPHGGEVGRLRGFADAGVPVIALTCLPPSSTCPSRSEPAGVADEAMSARHARGSDRIGPGPTTASG